MANSGFLGCGTVYFNRRVSGVYQGWQEIGNATKFGIKSNSTLKERKSKKCNSYGQPVDAVSIPDPSELSIDTDTINRQNLAMAFLGNDYALSVAASTVTDEVIIAPVVAGASMVTALPNISAVVLTDSGASTTYVEGTDYTVSNAVIGMIDIIDGGAITSAQSLLVDYASGGVSGIRITGGTESQINVAIKLVGKNLVNDNGVVVDVWDAIISPNSEIDFLSDDFSNIQLTGRIQLDESKGNGYEVTTERVIP
jgi:hypothetical protein